MKISKKGQIIGESMALFSTTVLLILFFVAFFILIKSLSVNNKDTAAADSFALKYAAENSLVSYLNTPVKLNNENMSMTDLIELARVDSSYKELLQTSTHEILDRALGDKYSIDIKGLMVFPPRSSAAVCRKIPLPNNMGVTLCLK